MTRSFTDRVLAGVCGGIAGGFRLNAWLIRIIFIVATLLTQGAVALWYLALWWAIPQQSLVDRRGGLGSLLLALLLGVLIIGGWFAHQSGLLPSSNGMDIYVPGLIILLGLLFTLRQVRA